MGHDMSNSLARSYAILPETTGGPDNPKFYMIGDLAREFGVTLRTLRFYEDRGLLSPRREGTQRIYDARDRDRLSVILKGKQLGFTLTEIRAMLAEQRTGEGVTNLNLSLAQIEDQIGHLEQQRSRSRRPWPSCGPAARAFRLRPEPRRDPGPFRAGAAPFFARSRHSA
jgi:DNA-binding transcriptional MerR regulator